MLFMSLNVVLWVKYILITELDILLSRAHGVNVISSLTCQFLNMDESSSRKIANTEKIEERE